MAVGKSTREFGIRDQIANLQLTLLQITNIITNEWGIGERLLKRVFCVGAEP